MSREPDDSGGYCCAMAGMHMGHDGDCGFGNAEERAKLLREKGPFRAPEGLWWCNECVEWVSGGTAEATGHKPDCLWHALASAESELAALRKRLTEALP